LANLITFLALVVMQITSVESAYCDTVVNGIVNINLYRVAAEGAINLVLC
jgi:hypothetical protein